MRWRAWRCSPWSPRPLRIAPRSNATCNRPRLRPRQVAPLPCNSRRYWFKPCKRPRRNVALRLARSPLRLARFRSRSYRPRSSNSPRRLPLRPWRSRNLRSISIRSRSSRHRSKARRPRHRLARQVPAAEAVAASVRDPFPEAAAGSACLGIDRWQSRAFGNPGAGMVRKTLSRGGSYGSPRLFFRLFFPAITVYSEIL